MCGTSKCRSCYLVQRITLLASKGLSCTNSSQMPGLTVSAHLCIYSPRPTPSNNKDVMCYWDYLQLTYRKAEAQRNYWYPGFQLESWRVRSLFSTSAGFIETVYHPLWQFQEFAPLDEESVDALINLSYHLPSHTYTQLHPLGSHILQSDLETALGLKTMHVSAVSSYPFSPKPCAVLLFHKLLSCRPTSHSAGA